MADQSPTESDSSTTPEFPDKMRVHALAKLLGVTSKQVLAEAAALGTELRSAQSSLHRDVAQRIHASLTSAAEAIEPVVAELDTLIDPVVEAPVAEEPAAEAPVEAAPVAEAPAEKPVRARRTRKKVVVEEPAAEETVDPAVAEISAGLDAAAALQSKEAEQSDLFTSFEAPQTHQPEVAPAAPQVPLFLQPDLEAAEVAPRRRRARREPAAPAVVEEKQTTAEAETVVPEAAPVAVPAVEEPAVTAPQTEGESAESEDEDDDQPRRRRRGRR
ncbi:translation initiation factor IF-2 N-terminal domain-containing protein, partial [Rhodococcus sp. YH3-3]